MALSQEHHEIRAQARRFADEAIRPVAAELDRTERFPADIYGRMAGARPVRDHGPRGRRRRRRRYARLCPGHGGAGARLRLGRRPVRAGRAGRHAARRARQRGAEGHAIWAPLLRAERRCAYAITEAEAGSDVAAIRTTATRTARRLAARWRQAMDPQRAGVRLRGRAGAHRPGARPARHERVPGRARPARASRSAPRRSKMGQRASPVGALRFDRVHLPDDARLGPENRGFHMMMSVLDKGRIGIAALAVGHPAGGAGCRPGSCPDAAPVRPGASPSSRASSGCSPTWPRTRRRRAC